MQVEEMVLQKHVDAYNAERGIVPVTPQQQQQQFTTSDIDTENAFQLPDVETENGILESIRQQIEHHMDGLNNNSDSSYANVNNNNNNNNNKSSSSTPNRRVQPSNNFSLRNSGNN